MRRLDQRLLRRISIARSAKAAAEESFFSGISGIAKKNLVLGKKSRLCEVGCFCDKERELIIYLSD